ncbi:MAG: phosphoglucosamine mutase [Pirellulales bacterium]
MREEPIISVSGLRGVIGRSLTPDVAVRYVGAFVSECPPGPIVVSRDGRSTGPMLVDAIRSALVAAGRTVVDAGVAATPTTGVLVRTLEAAGGIQISASHNPAEYNGLKLFGADGRVIPAVAGQRVLDRYRRDDFAWQPHDRLGTTAQCDDTCSAHLALILPLVQLETIRGANFRVLLDSNRGAGSVLGHQLLHELGCHITLLGGTPDGRFDHPPEPTAENLAEVGQQVVAAGAAVGFCQDPDADRLALIDERGRYVGEEYTLALCVQHILQQRPGPVVINCSTSRMTADLAQRFGVPCYRSKVGEAHVCDLMQECQAVFGGEGNGGPIDPRVGFVRDSFVGMALVLDALAATGLPLSQLVDQLPRYAICKTKVTLTADRLGDAWSRLQRHFADAQADQLDGLRLDWPDRWLLIRASNTEPIVRIVAEAPEPAQAAALCSAASQVLSS